MAIASNSSANSVTVILANLDPGYYSLPYPAFQPINAYSTRSVIGCESIQWVAVHPISQVVYFSAWWDDELTGQIGHFLPNGSVSILSPYNWTSAMPVLFECWSLAFSVNGAYLYYGDYLMNGGFTIVQFNSTDGSIVRQLLTDEKGGYALALISDDRDFVYVVRAGEKTGHVSNGSISVYSPTSVVKQREVEFTLSPIDVQQELMAASLAWQDGVLYVADGKVVQAINCTLLREEGKLEVLFVFSQGMTRANHVAVTPDSTVVVADIDAGLLFLQGLRVTANSSSSSSASALSSSSPSSSSSTSSSSLSSISPTSSSSLPSGGTLLYLLSANVAMNISGDNTVNSIAFQTNNITGDFNVILASHNPAAVYSLPYPAFQPVDAHSTGCSAQNCDSRIYVAVHPISQEVYFTLVHDHGAVGQIGYFLPNGSVSIFYPRNDEPDEFESLLSECWSFEFSTDGAYLYFGNQQVEGQFSIVQFDSTDGSIVRQLLTNEKGGWALAFTTDDEQYVYVMRAGVEDGQHANNGSISVYSPTSVVKQREVTFTLSPAKYQREVLTAGMAWHDDVLYVADGSVVQAIDGVLLREQAQIHVLFVFSTRMWNPVRVAVMPDSTVVVGDYNVGLLILQGLGTASSSSSSPTSISAASQSSSSSVSSSLSSSTSPLVSSSSSSSSSASAPISSSSSPSSSPSSLASSSTSFPHLVSSATVRVFSSSSSSSLSSRSPAPLHPDDDRATVAWSSSVEYALSIIASLLIGVAVGLSIALLLMPRWRNYQSRSRRSKKARSGVKGKRELTHSLMTLEERSEMVSPVVIVHM